MMEMKKKRHHKVKTIKEIKENENEREPELKNTVERERGNSWQKKRKKRAHMRSRVKRKALRSKIRKRKGRRNHYNGTNQRQTIVVKTEGSRVAATSMILSFSRKGKRKRNRTKKSAAGLNGK